MSDSKPGSEPSIEEILGSIRRIIADDEQPSDTPSQAIPTATLDSYDQDEDEAPLELTQKIDEDGTVIDLQTDESDRYDDEEDLSAVSPAPSVASPIRPAQPEASSMIDFADNSQADPLVSSVAANATAAVMAKLARNTAINRQGHDGVTIEDLVKEMLRPMLSDWLDQNLPDLVQSMVERELEKISRRVG